MDLNTGTVASQKPENISVTCTQDIQTGMFVKLAARAVVLAPAGALGTTAILAWRVEFTDTLGSVTPVNCIE